MEREAARGGLPDAVSAGWLDGHGAATDSDAYRRAVELAATLERMGAPAARAYPTLSGGIELAWTVGHCEVSAYLEPAMSDVEIFSVHVGARALRHAVVPVDDAKQIAEFAGLSEVRKSSAGPTGRGGRGCPT